MDSIINFRSSRAQEMWKFISSTVDFEGKLVVDIGCGYGDFALLAATHGAERVDAIDVNPGILNHASNRSNGMYPIKFKRIDAENAPLPQGTYDVGFCFSVLPYTKKPQRLVRRMAHACTICLIECQYSGDGPGYHFLKGDEDMKMWLLSSADFKTVSPIGSSLVEGRDKRRTIWLCSLQEGKNTRNT